jgi:hypothetical protein
MLLTGGPLAAAALAAADRSWVRQVFSFTEAAGTIAVSSLLAMGTLHPCRGRPHDDALLPFSPGADGRLRPTPVSHLQLADRIAGLTAGPGALTAADVVLVTPPSGDGLAYTALVDAALLQGAVLVAAEPAQLATAAAAEQATSAIVPRGTPQSEVPQLRLLMA